MPRALPAHRLALAVTAAAAGSGLAAGPASANLEARAIQSPATIHYPGTRSIVHRLKLTTADRSETVRIAAIPPTFAGPAPTSPRDLLRQRFAAFSVFRATGALQPVYSPIDGIGPLTVEGAGRLVPTPILRLRYPVLFWACARGYPAWWREVTLRLPARSTTTVVARYRTGHWAPWRDTDYRIAFSLERRFEESGPWLERDLVRSPRSQVRGRKEVRLKLRSRPALGAPPGRRIRLYGTTDPPLRRRWIDVRLRARRPSDEAYGPARLLARVRTDRRGRFAYRGWRRRWPLQYSVWAELSRRQGERPQHGCALLVFPRDAGRS